MPSGAAHPEQGPSPLGSLASALLRGSDSEHRRAANRAVGVSALGLGLTGSLELALALVTGSVALLGDALHNLSDVSTSAVIFAGFRVSRRPPSSRYPYGYERAEDLAGLGVALVVWASAVFAGYESWRKLVSGSPTSDVYVGMAGAVLGILGNQLVARYKLRVGRRIHSATLLADARHSWLDAMSSLGALSGLVLVALGLRWGDPVAGFAVTCFILHVGWEVTTAMVHHLLDGVEGDQMEAARAIATSVPGVLAAEVRGRWTGRSLGLDVELAVDPETSARECDAIGAEVARQVLGGAPEVTAVRWSVHAGTAS